MVQDIPTPTRQTSIDLSTHVWMAWLAVATVTLSATKPDPDLWGHTKFGLDWWGTGTLPVTDPYSFTQDRPWINHEWLSEAFMGGAFALGGTPGLILLKLVVIASALLVLSRRLRDCAPVVTAGVLTLVLVCILPISLTVRPQLWSLAGLVLLVALIDRERPPGLVRTLVGMALFVAWANLHGGWITGAAVLIAYAVTRAVRERVHARRWLIFVSMCAFGTLLNPYGVGLWRFLVTTVRTSRPDVTEWAPLTAQAPIVLWLPLVAVLLVALILQRRQDTRLPIEIWAVLLLLVVGAGRVLRVAPLVAPAGMALLGPYICRACRGRGRISVVGKAAATVFWIPVVVAGIAAAQITTRAFGCVEISDYWSPDLRAAAHLRGATGKLLTTFNWGEYAIWHFGPELKVSVDGRRETVYSDSVIAWHRAFERGDSEAQQVVLALSPDYVWLPSSRERAKLWLLANGYRLDADTETSFVAVKQTLPRRNPAEVMSRCFP